MASRSHNFSALAERTPGRLSHHICRLRWLVFHCRIGEFLAALHFEADVWDYKGFCNIKKYVLIYLGYCKYIAM